MAESAPSHDFSGPVHVVVPDVPAEDNQAVMVDFTAVQRDVDEVNRALLNGATSVARKEKATDEEPYEQWLERLWRDEPGWALQVERVSPKSVPINGQNVPCAGVMGMIEEYPHRMLLQQRFGGGSYELKMIAPSNTVAGESRTVGKLEIRLPGMPIIPPELLGSFAPQQQGMMPPYMMPIQGGRGRTDTVGDAAVSTAMRAMENLVGAQAVRADNGVKQVADVQQQASAQVNAATDRAIKMAEELAAARAAEAAAKARNDLLEQRLSMLENRSPPSNDTPAMIEALARFSRPEGASSADSLTKANEELRRQVEDLRAVGRKNEEDLRAAHREALTAMQTQHQNEITRLRDEARHREEDTRQRNREDIDRARESEKSAARAELAAKGIELTSVQSELARVRTDYTETRSKLSAAESTIADLRAKVAELNAELAHRPKEPTDPLAMLATVEKIKRGFGVDDDDDRRGRRGKSDDGDDAPADPWWMRLANTPMGQMAVSTLFGGLTGENEKLRRAQLAQQKMQTDLERARLASNATVAAARAAVVTGARPGAGPAVPNPFAQPQATTPAPNPAGPPQQPAPAISLMERGDPPFPPPAPPNKPLAAQYEGYRHLLVEGESFLRKNISPAQFFDQAKKQLVARGLAKPATFLWDMLKEHKSHTLFWQALKAGGAAEAFPGLDHPAGQRWLRQLWTLVSEAANAGG